MKKVLFTMGKILHVACFLGLTIIFSFYNILHDTK